MRRDARHGRNGGPLAIGWRRALFLGAATTVAISALSAGASLAQTRSSTQIIPDRFLRRWDPVTIFFPVATGPTAPAPEDSPERFAHLDPPQAGAWSWVDARTLQFRPAEPWPPLARVTVTAGGSTARLATLLAAPVATVPAAGEEGLAPLQEISLTFAEPIAPAALAAALVVEHRALPGFASDETRRLGSDDFDLVAVERASPSEPATYRLRLKQAIPTGRRILLRFRLSLDEAPGSSFHEVAFATAEPFRVVRFGCRQAQLPALPGGARYAADQALACEASDPAIVVELSAAPRAFDAVAARNLVRLTPPVANLEPRLSGRRIELRGAFARATAYRLTLAPTALHDERDRPLELAATNELSLSFPRATPYLAWIAASGVVERFGPRMLPVGGRGDERIDLRVHRVDPLDRSFWPFPEQPVAVDENRRPPGPGEAPPPFTPADGEVGAEELARQIAALGSPAASALVDLPLRRDGASASFGLDLAPVLAKAAGVTKAAGGANAPGTYLVGMRRLGESGERRWMRLQVTDLALATLEERARVVFVVTSLATAQPVAGAEITIEGTRYVRGEKPAWETLWRGLTDSAGRVEWLAPGDSPGQRVVVRRIVARLGDDRLVLDPENGPDSFTDNRWDEAAESWLQWTQESIAARGAAVEWLAHLFVDRPVYRPDDPVRIKGYLRSREAGRLAPLTGEGRVIVEGPGDLIWRYPRTIAANGSVDFVFDEDDLPTGTYRVRFELDETEIDGVASFRKEAYRLPRFEVQLDAVERAPLDEPFEVALRATYYAGGRVAARPVAWRVTQFPYDWRPQTRPGWFYSSDGRYSRVARFESTPALERAETTDDDGFAKLALDPTIEPTSQPRTYVVEATVVGADDQTVTASRQIVSLPPFLLGLKVPRVVERPGQVAVNVLALGPDEKAIAGQKLTLRLVRRRWHAHLRASDVTDGVARYVTEVVDEKLLERELVSTAEALATNLALDEAGVYLVELEGHDRLGRAQSVAVDLFVGGDQAVSWERPPAAVFQVSPDKAKYAPGEIAKLVLESPFQNGEALAAIEALDGFEYRFLPVRGGKAILELPIEGHWTPRLPVHFLLWRGRLAGTAPVPGNATDLGRPATFGATVWLEVEPVDLRLNVALASPAKAQPGEEIEIGVELTNPAGAPLPGEVTLWLVDQAVLALGKEARLDPLPTFLTAAETIFSARDTRSLIFGFLPFVERPGGDGGEEARGPLDRQTVRKNFQPVPFYEASIAVGADGKARVRVKLSDDLTNFKLRAKAISGAERFGFATGHLEVRQPVVVEPALPRFVRPGDKFLAGAVGRVVEGAGGAGTMAMTAEGATIEGPARQAFEWIPDRAQRGEFAVSIPTPGYDAAGELARREVVLRIGAERALDGAGDAVETRLPLVDDRDRIIIVSPFELAAGERRALPSPSEAVRAGSLRRELVASTLPGVLELAAGLDFLLDYPYGCTEQRLATARVALAMRGLRDRLGLRGGEAWLERSISDTLDWIPLVEQPDGLVAFWPGSKGSVALTAWTGEFLAEARETGVAVDDALIDRITRVLAQALRSDYAGLIDGSAWAERSWALRALARLGKFDAAYGNELARRAQLLDLEGASNVVLAFSRGGRADAPAVTSLVDELTRAVIVRLHQGKETYGGLQSRGETPSGLILPSEARTLAAMLRALATPLKAPAGAGAGAPGVDAERARRVALMTDALIAGGRGDGWGSTNANSEAMLALAERLATGVASAAELAVVRGGGGEDLLRLGEKRAASSWIDVQGGEASVEVRAATAPVGLRAALSYLPAAPGSEASARTTGFVVSREALVYRHDAATGAPPERRPLTRPGEKSALRVGDIVEEHVQVVNGDDRHFVAVSVPIAAGMEPLNPNLETAPPEARPAGALTLAPAYAAFLDDRVDFFFNELPRGTYDFYFRSRAQISGEFIQPSARAEMMYDASVVGSSPGGLVVVSGH